MTPFVYPKPTGKFSVGTLYHTLTDSSREETHKGGFGPRTIGLKLWYPSDEKKSDPTPIGECFRNVWKEKKLYASSKHVGKFGIVDTLRIHSHEGLDLSSAQVKFPVVILSPGFDEAIEMHEFHAAELASHGYIVVGVSHPFAMKVTCIPGKDPMYSSMTASDFMVSAYADEEQKIWISDVQLVIDSLSDDTFPFTRHLDTSTIGGLGHSLGGSTFAHLSAVDNRLKAFINLDGGIFGSTVPKECNAAYLNIVAEEMYNLCANTPFEELYEMVKEHYSREQWKQILEIQVDRSQQFLQSVSSDAYKVVIPGLFHNAFNDALILHELEEFSHLTIGSRKDTRVIACRVNAVILTFFNTYLAKIAQKETLEKQLTIL